MQATMPIVRLMALKDRLPPHAVFSGRTAGWLHGLDVSPCDPIEVTLPRLSCYSHMAGISLTRSDVRECEISSVLDLPTTSRVRTIADLGRRLSLIEAVVVLDMALRRRLAEIDELNSWAADHPRYRGAARLLQAARLTDSAAESPMESRLRLLLVLNGLPKPCAQVRLYDHDGFFVARPDLYYPAQRLAIEYDGSTHRVSLTADNRRQNRLLEAGYRLLRFTAADILNSPASVVGLVRRNLGYSSIGSPN